MQTTRWIHGKLAWKIDATRQGWLAWHLTPGRETSQFVVNEVHPDCKSGDVVRAEIGPRGEATFDARLQEDCC
jgi:hypothetical protein